MKDCNGAAAARRAGYSAKTSHEKGSQLLAIISVQEEIQKSLAKVTEECEVTVRFVLEGFLEVAERCLQRKPVIVFDREEKKYIQEEDGDGHGIWTFDASGANKALEMLGKYKAMFTDVKKHEVGDGLGEFFKSWAEMKVAAEKGK